MGTDQEVFFNQPRFRFYEKGQVRDEDMYTAFGRSSSGRYLILPGVTNPLLSRIRYLRPPPTHFLDGMIDAFSGLRRFVAGQTEDEGHYCYRSSR